MNVSGHNRHLLSYNARNPKGKRSNIMKIQTAAGGASAAALVLALALGSAACGGKDDNANNSNTARNANVAAPTATATPTPVSTSEDTAIKNKTEAALTKAGVTGVT